MADTPNVTMREAHDRDVASIATIFALSCSWAYRNIFPPELLADYTPERQSQRWANHLASLSHCNRLLVAAQDGAVIGFIEIGPSASAHDSGVGEVQYLFVHPSHVRCGVGGQLMRVGETWLEQAGYTAAVLWVFRDNTRARTFYERSGWTATGSEKLETTLVERGYAIIECEYRRHLTGDPPQRDTRHRHGEQLRICRHS
jgi:GNAT superfamily N-acetyltransferase